LTCGIPAAPIKGVMSPERKIEDKFTAALSILGLPVPRGSDKRYADWVNISISK
jgi:hypothetical protein